MRPGDAVSEPRVIDAVTLTEGSVVVRFVGGDQKEYASGDTVEVITE